MVFHDLGSGSVRRDAITAPARLIGKEIQARSECPLPLGRPQCCSIGQLLYVEYLFRFFMRLIDVHIVLLLKPEVRQSELRSYTVTKHHVVSRVRAIVFVKYLH